ncbi:serine hydrolase [Sphingobacterium faecium]|uniref:serine hydrolase n=1 Tax=Sphingobacterium faecium TaxID=34087 RepID=UPI0024791BAE|nr:serine hydrolase [Sphingobacterium faecium]WGQ14616.1 serine hydrolase [Sphingobacterium faecium]
MKTSFMALLCLGFSVLFPQLSPAQDHTNQLDSLVNDGLPNNAPGTVLYLTKGDQVLYQKALGKANLELDVDLQVDHVFRLGSVSKQFTACAILKLAEEGKLSLQDDIRQYIPDFPIKDQMIAIEALLTHTAGVKNYTGLASFTEELKRKDLSPAALINLFKNEPLEYEPGTNYKYSNSGYILLGYIIEKITGQTYATYIEETFFKPLVMRHSYFDHPVNLIKGRVSGYSQRNGRYQNAHYLSMTLPYAAGSLASTSGDIQICYNALYHGQVLKPETLKHAFTSYTLINGRSTGYGYGWEIANIKGTPSVKHVGVINGFYTYVAYLPDEQITLSIFRNSDSPTDLDILASKMLAVVLEKPYMTKELMMTAAQLTIYQGVYTLDNGEEYRIRLEDGYLVYYNSGGTKTRLVPTANDQFILGNSLNTLSFKRTKQGKVADFIIKGTGIASNGYRKNVKISLQSKMEMSLQMLQRYVGGYQFQPGPVFEVILENNKLYGQVGHDKKELVPYAEHKFFARDLDASLIFQVNSKGSVIGLTKIQNGEMTATKL